MPLDFPNNQSPPELQAFAAQNPQGAQGGLDDLITSYFAQARQRTLSQDLITPFTEMQNAINAQPAPTNLPVPAALHPIGQMAAAFASTMAEMMGARGAVSAHQERVQNNANDVQRVQEANINRQDQFEQKKAQETLQIRMKINEARAEQAKQLGDLNEYEARLKTGAALQRERDKQNQDAKERFMKEQDGLILNRILTGIKARGEQSKELATYRNVLKTAISTSKASDALKLWGKMQYAQIYAKDLTGEYALDDATREKKAEEVYNQFLERMHAEQGGTAPHDTTSIFESFFNEGK